MPFSTGRLFGFTFIALLAFAANSILCRLALRVEEVAPLDFSLIRILSASLILWLLLKSKGAHRPKLILQHGSHKEALYLLVYILGFSYAYIGLNTATGALILFAAVQFTMLAASLMSGKRLSIIESIGILISFFGLCYFVYPELDNPSGLNLLFMVIAGIAWGLYSLVGSQSSSPLLDTSSNFIRLFPFAVAGLMAVLLWSNGPLTGLGIFYSIASGALASGLGYALWYLVLPKLAKSVAAVCQLSVPVWAAIGGVLFVNEAITWHLVISAGFILGGITLVLLSQMKPQ